MATYRVLGQAAPTAATDATLYTVGSGLAAVTSTFTACNRGSADTSYRVAVRPAGATLANQHYVIYDAELPAYSTDTVTIGLTLAASDVVTVRSASGNVSFGLYGGEETA